VNEDIKEILRELKDIQTRLGRLEGFVYGENLLKIEGHFKDLYKEEKNNG
jgi:hypothetical protein